MSKTVVLGVTGSIAAYRAADLCSAFRKDPDPWLGESQPAQPAGAPLPGTSAVQPAAYEDEGEAEVAQGPRVRTLIIGLSLVIVAVIAVVVAFLIWGG